MAIQVASRFMWILNKKKKWKEIQTASLHTVVTENKFHH